jgi:hypothetical protein
MHPPGRSCGVGRETLVDTRESQQDRIAGFALADRLRIVIRDIHVGLCYRLVTRESPRSGIQSTKMSVSQSGQRSECERDYDENSYGGQKELLSAVQWAKHTHGR